MTTTNEPSWKRIFVELPKRAVRPRPYDKKPDGNQDQSYKDERD